MLQNIVIIGAGGFGREVQWLIERINKQKNIYNLIGYIDDGIVAGTEVNGYKVLGGIDYLLNMKEDIAAVCAIGAAKTRKKVIERLLCKENIVFPNLIDSSVEMSQYVEMGQGNIICAGCILTVNIKLEDFNIINLSCTIGHDVDIRSFVTVYPGVNISGCVCVGNATELGTGSKIIQGKTISENVIVGAGAVVVKDILVEGTYVGVPSNKVR